MFCKFIQVASLSWEAPHASVSSKLLAASSWQPACPQGGQCGEYGLHTSSFILHRIHWAALALCLRRAGNDHLHFCVGISGYLLHHKLRSLGFSLRVWVSWSLPGKLRLRRQMQQIPGRNLPRQKHLGTPKPIHRHCHGHDGLSEETARNLRLAGIPRSSTFGSCTFYTTNGSWKFN